MLRSNKSTISVNYKLTGMLSSASAKIPSHLTPLEAILFVSEKAGIKLHSEEISSKKVVIAPSRKQNGVVLDPNIQLERVKLNSDDVLELWTDPVMVSVMPAMVPGQKAPMQRRILLDKAAKLITIIPFFQKIFREFLGKEEFSFQAILPASSSAPSGSAFQLRWLNATQSLSDSHFDVSGKLMASPLQLSLKKKYSSIKDIAMEGTLTKQSGKIHSFSPKTGSKQRWFVLQDQFLYYYKKKTENPCGVISLEYHTMEKVPAKAGAVIVLQRTFFGFETKSKDVYYLRSDNDHSLNLWKDCFKSKVMNLGNKCFGATIESVMLKENSLGDVPYIIKATSEYLIQHGLKTEGIFRVPGDSADVERLKAKFDSSDHSPLIGEDIHAVSSLLKLYLRELPQPIIPTDLYSSFLSIGKIKDMPPQHTQKLIDQVARIPVSNFVVLKYLASFFHKVYQHADVNKMSLENLATVLGPNILRAATEVDGMVNLADCVIINQLTYAMIENHENLYHTSNAAGTSIDDESSNSSENQESSPSLSVEELSKDSSWKGTNEDEIVSKKKRPAGATNLSLSSLPGFGSTPNTSSKPTSPTSSFTPPSNWSATSADSHTPASLGRKKAPGSGPTSPEISGKSVGGKVGPDELEEFSTTGNGDGHTDDKILKLVQIVYDTKKKMKKEKARRKNVEDIVLQLAQQIAVLEGTEPPTSLKTIKKE